jgi:hypothetical protein
VWVLLPSYPARSQCMVVISISHTQPTHSDSELPLRSSCLLIIIPCVPSSCVHVQDETLATDMTCTAAAIAAAAIAPVENACTPLQQEVIRGCAEDCSSVRARARANDDLAQLGLEDAHADDLRI